MSDVLLCDQIAREQVLALEKRHDQKFADFEKRVDQHFDASERAVLLAVAKANATWGFVIGIFGIAIAVYVAFANGGMK